MSMNESDEKISKIAKPKIVNLQNGRIDDIYFEDEIMISGMNFCGGMIESVSAESVSIEKSVFCDVTFRDAMLPRADLSDVKFDHCNLANTNWSRSIIHRVEFVDCNMTGVDFGEATFRNAVFHNCSARYAFFRGADLGLTRFFKSNLSLTDFQQTKFSQLHFSQSNLSEAQMSGCTLSGINFSDCDIDGMQARLEDYKGAIVSPMLALDLVKIMRVIVK